MESRIWRSGGLLKRWKWWRGWTRGGASSDWPLGRSDKPKTSTREDAGGDGSRQDSYESREIEANQSIPSLRRSSSLHTCSPILSTPRNSHQPNAPQNCFLKHWPTRSLSQTSYSLFTFLVLFISHVKVTRRRCSIPLFSLSGRHQVVGP